jgi:murein DD-endopeptidase MepM/ murein hydrolase activator NlpD
MKKFYYFSKSKLHFIEVENFYRKFIFLIFFFAVLVAFFVFGSFLVFSDYINPDSELSALKKRNIILKHKLENLVENYKKLDQRLELLSDKNSNLRLSVNLEPIEKELNNYGTGGNSFEPLKVFDLSDSDNFVNAVKSFTDKVVSKSKQESDSFNEIEKTLIDNEKLFEVIPAIKPTSGNFGDGFKTRFHPILKIRQMHNGLDIICDSGTKVYAPGGGTACSVGWRNGTGLTVEIEHGFGYKTIYGHLSKTLVKEGQKIERGDLIALSGSSGSLSTGPHLHYEVRMNDIPLDPKSFIYDDVSAADINSGKNKSN